MNLQSQELGRKEMKEFLQYPLNPFDEDMGKKLQKKKGVVLKNIQQCRLVK